MKILIPTILSTKNKVGVSEYLIGLINSLQQIDNTNDYFIITTKENRHFFYLYKYNFHEIIVNIFDISRASLRLQYLLFSKFQIPSLVKKHRIDLIHEPCSWFINKNINTIVTIHDVVEINNSKYSFLFNFLKQKMILSSIKYSTSIISVSEQTTLEIKEIMSRDINTIYNGIPTIETCNCEIEQEVLKKYKIKPKQYFVFIGTLLKHKNLLSLLEAFRKFNNINSNFKLVLAGKGGNALKSIYNFIKRHSLENQIILTGYFEDNEKGSLLKNSVSLLLVSTKEGFGFPILEAQSLGVPVITSNASSMKEISNESTILVDPNSIDSITNAMFEILRNNDKVSKLISLGYKNIKRFSWDKSAKKTIKLYERVYIQNNSLNK